MKASNLSARVLTMSLALAGSACQQRAALAADACEAAAPAVAPVAPTPPTPPARPAAPAKAMRASTNPTYRSLPGRYAGGGGSAAAAVDKARFLATALAPGMAYRVPASDTPVLLITEAID